MERNFAKFSRETDGVAFGLKGLTIFYIKDGKIERISVPVHGNKPLKSGLLTHLMKIADIPKFEFK